MPKKSTKDEKQVIDFIFRENSVLEVKEQERTINTYYAIKHHMPSELFKTDKLKFNYNKGLTYILASYGDIQLFKIPNNKKPIEIICPPDKEFVKSLDIADTKKEKTLNKYKDTKATVWYLNLSTDEILHFSSNHWNGFIDVIKSIMKK